MDETTPTPPNSAPTVTGSAPQGDELVKDLSRHLYQAKGWMKLLGVLSIIQGVLMIFSIWGILLCWLPIWIGVVLHRAAGRVEMAYLGGDRSAMREGTEQLQRFFTINGVLALIYVVITGAVLFFLLVAGGLGALSSLMES
jgi:hypothetical protein